MTLLRTDCLSHFPLLFVHECNLLLPVRKHFPLILSSHVILVGYLFSHFRLSEYQFGLGYFQLTLVIEQLTLRAS